MTILRFSTLLILSLAGAATSAAQAPKARVVFAKMAPVLMGLFLSDADGHSELPLLPATGLDYAPSFSPDGHWIVFTSERAGSADVYRVHPDGSGLERLTHSPSFDDQGVLSPDGKTLAFVSTRTGGTANIWLLGLERRTYTNLTGSRSGNFRPSWSPDGEWIAFTSDRGEPHRRDTPSWELLHFTAVYIIHPNGGGLHRLTALGEFDHSPHWTADGRHVVYSSKSTPEAPAQTFSIDIKTHLRALFHSDRQAPSDVEHPAWSPDGKLLVYSKVLEPLEDAAGTITPVFSMNSHFELFRTGAFAAASPDGEHILLGGGVGNGTNNLKILDADGSHLRKLFAGPKGSWLVSPSWSPNGRMIAMSIGNFFARPVKPAQLALVAADRSKFRVLTYGAASSGFPSFSPDGEHLVYRVLGGAEQGLRVMDLRDGSIRKLTDQWDNFPAWSPRGDLIAFTSFRTGDFEIYTIRPDGTDLRQLTHDHGNDAHPSWSTDGMWILFTSSRMGWKDEGYGSDQSYGEIFAMHSDGSDLQQLTDNPWEEATAAWLPAPHQMAAGMRR